MLNSELERLNEVKKFLELDFHKNADFQNIVDLAAQVCEKPIALITLLDKEQNWLKVKTGTDATVMPRETSFCQYGIAQDDLFVVADATKDSRFDNNPLVHDDPNLRFYAGAPLTLTNGLKLGTLCVFGQQPSELTATQQKILPILSKQVVFLMELELGRLQLQEQIEQTEAKNDALIKIAQLQSHQIRQPLTTIMGLAALVKNDPAVVDKQWLEMFEMATQDFDKTIVNIIAETMGSKDLKAIRFHKMVEQIDDYAIILLDEAGVVENWNKGAEKLKGYAAREIVGKHFSVFFVNEDLNEDRPAKLIAKAKEFGFAKGEGWRVRKDGSKFWVSVVITAIHNEQNEVIGFTEMTRDLTEVKNAEDAQTLTIDMYNQLSEQTNKLARVGGWEYDLEKDTLLWTSITREIHGVDDTYIPEINKAIGFYKEGSSRQKIQKAVEEAIEKGTTWDLKLTMINAQGKEILVHSVGKSNYRNGVTTKVYGTFQFINERKKKERKVKVQ